MLVVLEVESPGSMLLGKWASSTQPTEMKF